MEKSCSWLCENEPEQLLILFVLQSISEETSRETSAGEKGADFVHDPQYHLWKEEAKKKERAVELQEQAEVLAKVMKDQLDQTMSALSPSLTTPPQFPPSPPGVTNLHLVADETRRQNDLLGAPQLRWTEAVSLHKVFFGRNGASKEEFVQTLGEQFRRHWASS